MQYAINYAVYAILGLEINVKLQFEKNNKCI